MSLDFSIFRQPVTRLLLQHILEKIVAYNFLLLFCIFPIIMTWICCYYGVEDGFTVRMPYCFEGSNYVRTLETYCFWFRIVGVIVTLFILSIFAIYYKRTYWCSVLREYSWSYFLVGLLIWALVATLFSDDLSLAFWGTDYRCDGLLSYFIYAAVFICALSIADERHKRNLMRLFTWVVDILSVVMLLEVMRVWPVYLIFQAPRAAVFNQFNHFGYILCMGSLCAAGLFLHDPSKRMRVVHAASFALQVFALIINDTFGAYLAVIIGLIAIVAFWLGSGRAFSKRLLVPAAIFAALSIASYGGLFAPLQGGGVAQNMAQLGSDLVAIGEGSPAAGRAGTGRLALWTEALKMIPERPLFGYGPEGLTGEYAAKMGVDRPHNEFIQYAVFLGIPGLLLYVSALVALAVRQLRNLKRLSPATIVAGAVVVGYLASSFVGNTMFNTAPYFWMFLALAAADPAPTPT